jgi:hypothetical protein
MLNVPLLLPMRLHVQRLAAALIAFQSVVALRAVCVGKNVVAIDVYERTGRTRCL